MVLIYNMGMKDREIEHKLGVIDAITILFDTLPIEDQQKLLLGLRDRYLSQQPRLNLLHEQILDLNEVLKDGPLNPITINGLTVHFDGRLPTHNGKPVELTKIQQQILEVLAINNGIVVPAESLYEHVWGGETPDNYRERIWTQVSRLRKKLGDTNPDEHKYILNNKFGYYMPRISQNLEEE